MNSGLQGAEPHCSNLRLPSAALRRFEEELYEEQPTPEQAERVRVLFHRQLAVPLADGAETLAEYKAWEQGLLPEGSTFEVGRRGGRAGGQGSAALGMGGRDTGMSRKGMRGGAVRWG